MASRMKLQTFLNKHRLKKTTKDKDENKPITHTRMGDTDHNIVAGSYSIPKDQEDTFYMLLYNDIIVKKGKEYLTEAQLKEDDGAERCIAIDMDFNYELGTKRQHSKDDVY